MGMRHGCSISAWTAGRSSRWRQSGQIMTGRRSVGYQRVAAIFSPSPVMRSIGRAMVASQVAPGTPLSIAVRPSGSSAAELRT